MKQEASRKTSITRFFVVLQELCRYCTAELHQLKNADGSPRYPELTVEPSEEDAIDVLLKAAEECGSDLTIVAIGPLTNIATALQRDRATMQKVGRIVIMGGALKVPGNISAAAEFNFFVSRCGSNGYGIRHSSDSGGT